MQETNLLKHILLQPRKCNMLYFCNYRKMKFTIFEATAPCSLLNIWRLEIVRGPPLKNIHDRHVTAEGMLKFYNVMKTSGNNLINTDECHCFTPAKAALLSALYENKRIFLFVLPGNWLWRRNRRFWRAHQLLCSRSTAATERKKTISMGVTWVESLSLPSKLRLLLWYFRGVYDVCMWWWYMMYVMYMWCIWCMIYVCMWYDMIYDVCCAYVKIK